MGETFEITINDNGIIEDISLYNEPVGYDSVDFNLQQEKGRYGRDISFAGGEIELEFTPMAHPEVFDKIVEQFELLNDKEVEFESRYFYDQAYYTASDANDLFVFNDQGKLLLTESLDNLDFEALRAKHNLADDISFAYAIHEDELVYAVYDDKYEYLYSVKTNELVLKFRKGIVND